ncbi:hypothetical protein Hanom_Chr09g00794041 [Helianthus anomalus]
MCKFAIYTCVNRCFVFKMKMVIKKRSPPKDYNASSGFRGKDGVFFVGCYVF